MFEIEDLETHLFTQNRILAALPRAERERLSPHLNLTRLPLGLTCCDADGAFSDIYFPVTSIVSVTRLLADGTMAETSIAGNDGAIGLALLFDGEPPTSRAIVYSAGYAFRLKAALGKQEFFRHGALQDLVLKYMQMQMAQYSQNVACNRHHTLEQHFCRWLLHSLDLLPSDTLISTQTLIANLLGVRRESITAACSHLHQIGIIECGRGRITVRDRRGLESLSCECYKALRTESLQPLRNRPSTRRHDSGFARHIFEKIPGKLTNNSSDSKTVISQT